MLKTQLEKVEVRLFTIQDEITEIQTNLEEER